MRFGLSRRALLVALVFFTVQPTRPGEPITPLPDRDELILDGFTAVHGGATVWLNGSKRPVPGTYDRKLVLHVGAEIQQRLHGVQVATAHRKEQRRHLSRCFEPDTHAFSEVYGCKEANYNNDYENDSPPHAK